MAYRNLVFDDGTKFGGWTNEGVPTYDQRSFSNSMPYVISKVPFVYENSTGGTVLRIEIDDGSCTIDNGSFRESVTTQYSPPYLFTLQNFGEFTLTFAFGPFRANAYMRAGRVSDIVGTFALGYTIAGSISQRPFNGNWELPMGTPLEDFLSYDYADYRMMANLVDAYTVDFSYDGTPGGGTLAGKILGSPLTVVVNGYLYDDEPVTPPSSDPFAPGGTSEAGGGGGTFDDESDEIPDSSLPTLSAANTGFTRIYNPTLSQVQAMANYLWTDDSVIETIWNHIKQFLEDPMDAFIAFNLVPCTVPNGGTSNFKVMYIDTGVAMTTAANQFVDVDCGTVQLDRYYGSALDYTPYTRVGCFLPYIGTVELDTDEVMGATLQVKYRIDIVSGACVAKIFVDGTCLYQYSGHCAINIPFTSADFSNYVNAIIQVAKAGLIAASGVPITSAGAGEAAEQLTGRTVTTTRLTLRNPVTGRQNVAGTKTTEREIYSTEASFKGLSPSNLANTVGAVMGSKPMIEHSGGFNGNSGYLGIRRPFLIIKRPRMCNPSGYGALNGYPCMIKETLGNLSGYTQVQQVQLTGLSATNPEQAEILQLLKQGVIL